MQVYIGVKGFGKIESAEININNFTIFVGNNNSGKTYLMQLIYGVIDELVRCRTFEMEDYFPEDIIANEIVLDKKFVEALVLKVNVILDKRKEEIIRKIFHNSIPIKQLYLKVTDIHETYKILCKRDMDSMSVNAELEEEIEGQWNHFIFLKRNGVEDYYLKFEVFFARIITAKEYVNIFVAEILADMFGLQTRISPKKQMAYLPASRTGLMLLYRYFFANQNDVYMKEASDMIAVDDYEGENRIQVPSPVYDFLQFLLTYELTPKRVEENKALISFVETHLLGGKLMEMGDITYYEPLGEKQQKIPLYLASSMVNEIAPLNKILTGFDRIKILMYDEIETCMHPTKQVEMARLLNRLNNAGMHLLVSTHSETMATRINNLLLLSKLNVSADKKKLLLEQLGLEEEDLLQSSEVHVYQFTNSEDGRSQVRELEFVEVPYVGYEFDQFNDNSMNLYQEARTILGVDE